MENVGQRSYETWGEPGSPTDVGDFSLNGYERNVLFWNQGGSKFVDIGYGAHCDRLEDGRGLVTADFDRDGQLDVLVQNFERPAVLLMGSGAVGHWLQVRLQGAQSARDAAGAFVTVEADGRAQHRQVALGSGYLSSPSTVLHYGLGIATEVTRLTIDWPSGRRQVLENLPVNQRLLIREGSQQPEPRIVPASDRR
ncbi:MAG: CRTAC1 family protein [Planctomycetota bacterium]